ncbi:MAG: 2-dehydro-3-deoxyphosphooctonate aldolase [Bacteroidota bacterium]
MKTAKHVLFFALFLLVSACGSITSSLKNVDNNALKPAIKENHFIVTEYSSDKKYGYHKDYPINLGFENEKASEKNVAYFFNALAGKNGEKISYEKIETCCPFPTKRNKMGAGSLDIYEITFEGSDKKIRLYINIFEKGKILCPVGFAIKP